MAGLNSKRLCQLLLFMLLGTFLFGCSQTPREALISGEAQGTTYHIKFVQNATSSTTVSELQKQITRRLDEIDKTLSNYRPDSEISLINQQEATEWIAASPEIIGLIAISRTVYEKSHGCFDLTVKALFDLWGFSKHEPKIPKPAHIESIKQHIGMSLLELDQSKQRLRKKDPQLKIDLASIAQGYSVGQLAKLLEANGIHDYMVEIGGEMMVKGHKANGQTWRIGIESPTPEQRNLYKAVTLSSVTPQAVMTAGTYRNYFEVDGHSYSHILNPKTGWPVNHRLRSVTVVHDDPAWADAWDTALLCLGEQEAIKAIESENLAAFLVYEDNNEFLTYSSHAFGAVTQMIPPAQSAPGT